ncbi:MAG: DM13 domain-containing protein [Anaerolineae bacterium]|nr:DM13 domain-containing protein [Anaerolineae bacterium]
MPDMPTEPTVLGAGSFVEIDAIHRGEGQATVYRLEDGRQLLRLEDFRVTNGPDLHVILSRAEAPRTHEEVGDYVDLGSLKGNVGEQNYDIPPDVDLTEYHSIVIYCVPFHVVFSTATLEAM